MVTFKLIPGSENYYAGDDGNIYSKFNEEFKQLAKSIQSTKKYYCLSIVKNTVRKTYRVHRLICEAFHGTPKVGMTCSHIDGNWRNNNPDNLRWESQKDNLERKKIHGTDDKGYRNSRALINEEQLKEIRNRLKDRQTHSSIAKLFKVSRIFITKINSGYRYKDQK